MFHPAAFDQLGARPTVGPPKRIIRGVVNQTRGDWVVDDLSEPLEQIDVVPDDVIVAAVLPERSLRMRPAVVVTGILLSEFDKRLQVRLIRHTLRDQMGVVRHEAVRKNFKLLFSACAQHLLPRETHDISFDESRISLKCHQRQEISVLSDIAEGPAIGRVWMYHARRGARTMPHERVSVVSGNLEAEQVRAFLEANGIRVLLRGETLRSTHGLSVDGLGAVAVEVAADDAARARELLAAADAGELRLEDDSSDSNADG